MSKPPHEVEDLTGLVTTEETVRRKLSGNDVKDQLVDVGGVGDGTLEEPILGLMGGLIFVDRGKTTVSRDLLAIEGLELGGFGSSGDALESD